MNKTGPSHNFNFAIFKVYNYTLYCNPNPGLSVYILNMLKKYFFPDRVSDHTWQVRDPGGKILPSLQNKIMISMIIAWYWSGPEAAWKWSTPSLPWTLYPAEHFHLWQKKLLIHSTLSNTSFKFSRGVSGLPIRVHYKHGSGSESGCSFSMKQYGIADPRPGAFWPMDLDPGWNKIQIRDLGWTFQILFLRTVKSGNFVTFFA